MKIATLAAASLAIVGCAASEPRNELALTAPVEIVSPTEVREVSLESFADVANCRRYVATGTRIAVQRCEPLAQTAEDRLAYEQTKTDLESMRRQQMLQEQARQQAAAEAARRRMGP